VSPYRHIDFFVSSKDNFYGTVKVKGSNQADVNFSGVASSTNRWDYVQVKTLDTGATVNGVTGITYTGTDDYQLFEVNTNYLKNVAFEVATTTTGSVSVYLTGSSE
jgi:hypothetical protein